MTANGAKALRKTVRKNCKKLYKLCNSFRCNCYGCQSIDAMKVYIFGFAIKMASVYSRPKLPSVGRKQPLTRGTRSISPCAT